MSIISNRPDWSSPELASKSHVDIGNRRFYNPVDMRDDRISLVSRTANHLFGIRLSFYERVLTTVSNPEPDLGQNDDTPDPIIEAWESTPEQRTLEQQLALATLLILQRQERGQPIEDLIDRIECLRMELFGLKDSAGQLPEASSQGSDFDVPGLRTAVQDAINRAGPPQHDPPPAEIL